MERTGKVTIDINRGISYNLINFVQKDTLNYLEIECLDNRQLLPLLDKTITIKILRPDNTASEYFITNFNNNVATWKLPIEAVNIGGTFKSVIKLYEGGEKLTSNVFTYQVTEELGNEPSSIIVDYPLLDDLIAFELEVENAETNRKLSETERETKANSQQNVFNTKITEIDNKIIEVNNSKNTIESVANEIFSSANTKITELNALEEEVEINETNRVNEFATIKNEYETATHQNTDIEIVNARGGFDKLGNRINAIDGQLADSVNKPRVSMNFLAARMGLASIDGASSSDYVALRSFGHTFDVKQQVTNLLLALETPMGGRTTQRILKSIDGGMNWTVINTLPISFDTGVYYTHIYFEPNVQYILLVKQTSGGTYPTSQLELRSSTLNTVFATQDIGTHTFLSSTHCVASNYINGHTTIMCCEYTVNPADVDCNVWMWQSTNSAVWTKVMTQPVATDGTGIRHFHSIQIDPFTGYWWLTSGDSDTQSKIWKSVNNEPLQTSDWSLMYSGSQKARTCNLLFEQNYIYYGMDAIDSHIYKTTKDFTTIVDLGGQTDGHPIYMITRTWLPSGFLVFARHEPFNPTNSDRTVIQFYSFAKQKLYEVCEIPHYGSPSTEYFGFTAASRFQDTVTGDIFVNVDSGFRTKLTYTNNVAGIGNLMKLKIDI